MGYDERDQMVPLGGGLIRNLLFNTKLLQEKANILILPARSID